MSDTQQKSDEVKPVQEITDRQHLVLIEQINLNYNKNKLNSKTTK